MSAPMETLEATDDTPATAKKNRALAVANHHLPAWLFVVFVVVLLGIAVVSHALRQPIAINVLLGVAVLTCMAMLYSFKSETNDVGLAETFLGIFLVLTGMGIGSSPSFQPALTEGWKAAGLAPSLKFESGPAKEMYSMKDGTIYPTAAVSSDFELIVGFDREVDKAGKSKFKKMQPVTSKGVQIGTKDAEVWLQERATGATSNSIPVEYDAPPVTAETKKDSETAAEKPTVKESDSAPSGTEPKPDDASPKTDPPPADTGTEKPKTDDPDSTEPGSARA